MGLIFQINIKICLFQKMEKFEVEILSICIIKFEVENFELLENELFFKNSLKINQIFSPLNCLD